MIKLAEKYGGKPAEELPMLFQRILQNTIRDYYRRQKVRSYVDIRCFQALQSKHEEEEFDPLDVLEDSENSKSCQHRRIIIATNTNHCADRRSAKQTACHVNAKPSCCVTGRDWTQPRPPQAMGCTEGSVKTHCSRAVHALSVSLKAKGVELP